MKVSENLHTFCRLPDRNQRLGLNLLFAVWEQLEKHHSVIKRSRMCLSSEALSLLFEGTNEWKMFPIKDLNQVEHDGCENKAAQRVNSEERTLHRTPLWAPHHGFIYSRWPLRREGKLQISADLSGSLLRCCARAVPTPARHVPAPQILIL